MKGNDMTFDNMKARIAQWDGYMRDEILFLMGMGCPEYDVLEMLRRSWDRIHHEVTFLGDLFHWRKQQYADTYADLDGRYVDLRERVKRLYKGSLDD